jgi:hypothetical protein
MLMGLSEDCPARIAFPAHESSASASASTSGGTSKYDFKVCRSLGRNGPMPLDSKAAFDSSSTLRYSRPSKRMAKIVSLQ